MSDNFEWDDEKALANFAKHGVSFQAARDVFRDPFAIDLADDRFDYREARHIVIGMAQGRLLFVAYTMRQDKTRLISARAAEPQERRWYHEQDE
jgi:uncharacterized DUF497 family protein